MVTNKFLGLFAPLLFALAFQNEWQYCHINAHIHSSSDATLLLHRVKT